MHSVWPLILRCCWWPSVAQDVEFGVDRCWACCRFARSKRQGPAGFFVPSSLFPWRHVIVDFEHGRVADQSALAAIETMAERYTNAGKRLVLRHLSPDCHALLRRAGQLVVESDDDPNYGLAVDYDVRLGALGGGH